MDTYIYNIHIITGEEHALVRDDSYRDVSQILSLCPGFFP